MPSGSDLGQFPTIFDDAPDDIHRASDMPHVENLTSPLDSAIQKSWKRIPCVSNQIGVTLESNLKHGPRVKYLAILDAPRTVYLPHLTRRHIPDIIHASTNDCR